MSEYKFKVGQYVVPKNLASRKKQIHVTGDMEGMLGKGCLILDRKNHPDHGVIYYLACESSRFGHWWFNEDNLISNSDEDYLEQEFI